MKKTIAGLEDLHGKFEHVLACLKRRVSKWNTQMNEENRTFHTLLGEWILGASYRAFLMRMPSSTRMIALKRWRTYLSEARIPLSQTSQQEKIIHAIVRSEIQDVNDRYFIRDKWQKCGIPSDEHAFWTCLCIHQDRCLPSSTALVQKSTIPESIVLIDPNRSFSRWIQSTSPRSSRPGR